MYEIIDLKVLLQFFVLAFVLFCFLNLGIYHHFDVLLKEKRGMTVIPLKWKMILKYGDPDEAEKVIAKLQGVAVVKSGRSMVMQLGELNRRGKIIGRNRLVESVVGHAACRP